MARQTTTRLRASGPVAALTLAIAGGACAAQTPAQTQADRPSQSARSVSPTVTPDRHPYLGMWVTADNHIRQELLPGGRYDEARGEQQSAYTGSYSVNGNRIDYVDDTGFTADGTFEGNDVLHHDGYVFYREGSSAHEEARTDQ